MKLFRKKTSPRKQRHPECGSMLLELMIAIVVLATGMCGVLPMLVSAMYTNNRSGNDTSSTMVAEHVLEQIAAQQASSSTALTINDCVGTSWTISTAGAASGGGNSGSYGGNGATLTSSGTVDWTQSYSGVPSGYAMRYVACGGGGRQTIFDVRWNVVTLSNTARMIFASARPSGSATAGGLRFVIPAQLRTIGGMP
jgi:Tfp pilus assembly protein PilV